MSLVNRRWLVIAGAAGMAGGLPFWVLRPDETVIEIQPVLAVTSLSIAPVSGLGLAMTAPLFSPDRTPPGLAEVDTSTEQANTAVPSAPVPALVGLVVRTRGRGVALVKGSDGQTSTLGPGEAVDGWEVSTIGKDRVTFVRGGESQVVALDFSNKGRSADATSPQIPLPPPAGNPATPLAIQLPASPGTAPKGQSGTSR